MKPYETQHHHLYMIGDDYAQWASNVCIYVYIFYIFYVKTPAMRGC